MKVSLGRYRMRGGGSAYIVERRDYVGYDGKGKPLDYYFWVGLIGRDRERATWCANGQWSPVVKGERDLVKRISGLPRGLQKRKAKT